VHWCKAFIRFSGLRHPKDLGAAEVEAFLTWLADERQLATSTHKQALSALIFLYSKVLQVSLPWVAQLERPRVRRRLPVVLSGDEVVCILTRMQGEHALLARLLYGTGMRISEALQLRVKDVDFSHQALIVREGKGGKDRVLMLAQSLAQPLRDQVRRFARLHRQPATPHTLRHCFESHLLQDGYDIGTVQDLLGHADVATTMIYTHVLRMCGGAVRSPLDALVARVRPQSGP
jgi:site-specific recombinase XerD